MNMNIDSIIFDLDGTLWNSTEAICSTWGLVLKSYPEIKKKITVSDLERCMGLPLDVIAERLFPEIEEGKRKELMTECCRIENQYLTEHGGVLYPDLEDTVKKLEKKYQLYIVSNCQDGYIQSFLNAHKMGKYFKDFECIGVTGLSKGENNKLIIKRNQLKSPVYVGDTQGDADSAKVAEIPFVYARYGFGQVAEYDYVIDNFKELLEIEWKKENNSYKTY